MGGLACTESPLHCIKGATNDQPGLGPARTCYQCKTSNLTNDINCIEPFGNNYLEACPPVLLGRPGQQCISIKYPDKVQRSCAVDDDFEAECSAADVSCRRCNADKCNENAYAGLFCMTETSEKSTLGWCIADTQDELACYLNEGRK